MVGNSRLILGELGHGALPEGLSLRCGILKQSPEPAADFPGVSEVDVVLARIFVSCLIPIGMSKECVAQDSNIA